jgi:DNA-directed RNA polymerase subunit M/transcription elongation factor TFIIS
MLQKFMYPVGGRFLMFCPYCSSYLTEAQLTKTNAKFMPGSRTPVEYDARCPACHREIGRMSWGKLEIKREVVNIEDFEEEPEEEIEIPAESEPAQPVKLCPHCGKPLPADF